MREHRAARIVRIILIVSRYTRCPGGGGSLFLPAVGAPQYCYSLKRALRSPTSIQKLALLGQGLSGVSFTEVPPEVKQLTNLSHLDLGCNSIHHLPEWLTQNPKITRISLATNQLSAFPPELAKMSNLKELDLNWNAIVELPPSIGDLVSLELLSMKRQSTQGAAA